MTENQEIQNAESIQLMEQGDNVSRQHRIVNIEELREAFSNRNFRRTFSIVDENKDGRISIQELKQLLYELGNNIPYDVVKRISQMSDTDNDGYLDYKEFVEMVNNPQFKVLFERYFRSYVKNLVPDRKGQQQTEGRSTSATDGVSFEDQYSCWPPPVCMVLISLIEIIFFSVDMIMYDTTEANGPMAFALMYNPTKRYQAWRYVTYMFVHVGYMHLCVNIIVQIFLGIGLEMVHKGWRVMIIYLAGVIAGSLGTSLTDPSVYLAGASGGVYSLITAHIASVIINWREMLVPYFQLLVFLLITVADFGTAIYNRYYLELKDNIGYEAHVAGALAGLFVGIFILINLETNTCENYLWWASLVVYIVLMFIAVMWNIFYPDYFPTQV